MRRILLSLAAVLALAAVALLLSACHTVGPRSLRHGRGTYNTAIQQTNSEQLLLNLVRLRYRDAPLFLEVTSISSSLSVEAGAGVGSQISPGSGVSISPGGAVTYTERPTITYAPLQGSRFGKQFLSPLELQDVLLLYHAGWAIDRIFKVFVQKLGPLQNAPRASGPTPDLAPPFDAYFAAMTILRSLWLDGLVDLQYVASVAGDGLLLTIEPTPGTLPRIAQLASLLGLPGPTSEILLTAAPRTGEANAVRIVPRSLLGGLYYISHGVEVPAVDLVVGRVPITRQQDGQAFDWRRVTGALMRVKHSAHEPPSAYVSVLYRGQWFYIDDSDLESKSTFSFVAQVLELQSGEVKSSGPLLTLPIAAE